MMSNSESTPATMETRNWSLCFLCQSNLKEPTMNPSTSVKLKNNSERISACYKEVADNTRELKELGALPDSIFTDDIGVGAHCGSLNIVQQMVTKQVVWHKSCRSYVDTQKVQRARKRHQGPDAAISPVKTRRISGGPSTSSSKPVNTLECFFCDEVGNKQELRKASTLGLDKKVNDYARLLGDKRLLCKLSAGDMVAIDAVYHRACLTRFYRKAETVGCDMTETYKTQVMRAHVLNELLDFIEDKRGSGVSLAMVDLTSLYDNRLVALGFPHIKCNTTRLRQDIERMIPDIKPVVHKNRCWSLVFDDDLSRAVSDMTENTSTEVSTLHKAAKILRKEYLHIKQAFTGSFSNSCDSEAESLPPTLRSFLHMLLDGPGIDQPHPVSKKSKAITSIGQQIMFNSVERRSTKPGSIPRHIRDRETPAALYMAMKLYLKTGSESVLDVLHQRGLCISYDRLRVLSTDIANSVIGHWEQVGVVVPPEAVKDVFTTGGFDNIDHNPSSTTAKTALHGTCISIHQHFSSDTQQVENVVNIPNPAEMGKKVVRSLPASYTTVDLDVSLPNAEVRHVPALGTNCHPFPASRSLNNILQDGYVWLEKVRSTLSKQTLEIGEWISWAAWYASITEPPATPPTKSYMLPLFTESSNSPTMVWHGMKVLRQAINYINPGQTPVMVADQPLFTLAKKLQWKYPQTEHGEDSYLVTLGAMHTEKMLWGVSGDWLDGSGWITALTNSGISTSGKAQSFIGVHHICRTRYMHQVSVAALYVLMKNAYDHYVDKATNDDDGDFNTLPFDAWLKQLCAVQPQADYWYKSMELDLLVLQFVKSCRTADFSLYMETLDSLMPWVFALDHTHYARNLPIHLRDMATLEERHPALYVEFQRGHFMGQKSKRSFSNIPRDQMHEQLIDWLKNHAGVIENLDDPSTVRREQVVRPEMARLVREFEGTKDSDERMHHEQYPKFQSDYKSDVIALVDAFEQLGNPFLEDSGELLDLDQSIFMPPDVVDNVRKVKDIGLLRYTAFLNKRVSSQEEAFTAPIHKSKLKLFKVSLSEPSRKSQVSVMKDQQAKNTHILLAANSGRSIDYVLSHESSTLPPSLTRKGSMYHGQKNELLDCIVPADIDNRRPVTTAAVLDGAVLIHMLRPSSAVTIQDYFTDVFVPYVLSWFETNDRVDIVWDVYSKTSLKSGTREQRGSGARRRVTLSTKIPGNWAAFLRVDMNKQELFVELANNLKLITLPQGKQLFTTILDDCATSPLADADVDAVAPCTHEEADTRIFLHVAAAASAGHRRVIVRSVDTDVVVLGVSTFVALGQQIDELWIGFGNSKRTYRCIPVHVIARTLGPPKAMALPAFHALTGCDTTSAFFGKGKKTAWSVWQSFPELTLPLQLLSCPNPSLEMIRTHTPVLERFVVQLYGVYEEDITTVDAARLYLLLHKGRDFENMPPSSDALHQHLLRVAYQSGHVWGNTTNKAPAPVSPTEWGWQQESPDSAPTPVYTTINVISRNLPELVTCQCKRDCKAPCSCCMHGQPCMFLCKCKGLCSHSGTRSEVQTDGESDCSE